MAKAGNGAQMTASSGLAGCGQERDASCLRQYSATIGVGIDGASGWLASPLETLWEPP